MIEDDEQSGKAAETIPSGRLERDTRRERLARTLRDNLARRKKQSRARRAGAADEASGLPAAKKDQSGD
ncbi:hypothetical protein [Ensifer soli]|uniref:hypothetical protein n=1 Tax=Ciceribacter sp. sgz301302 TaxID=3342379 RepID=UPI0035B86057